MDFDEYVKTVDFIKIKKFYTRRLSRQGMPLDEAEQAVYLALWHACEKYDETRGKFTTYFFLRIRWQYLNFMTALPPKTEALTPGHIVSREKVDVEELIEGLTEQEQYILRQYAKGYSYADIGRELGITRQAVQHIVKRVSKKLIEKYPISEE